MTNIKHTLLFLRQRLSPCFLTYVNFNRFSPDLRGPHALQPHFQLTRHLSRPKPLRHSYHRPAPSTVRSLRSPRFPAAKLNLNLTHQLHHLLAGHLDLDSSPLVLVGPELHCSVARHELLDLRQPRHPLLRHPHFNERLNA